MVGKVAGKHGLVGSWRTRQSIQHKFGILNHENQDFPRGRRRKSKRPSAANADRFLYFDRFFKMFCKSYVAQKRFSRFSSKIFVEPKKIHRPLWFERWTCLSGDLQQDTEPNGDTVFSNCSNLSLIGSLNFESNGRFRISIELLVVEFLPPGICPLLPGYP